MTPEDHILLLCTRQNFLEQHCQAVSEISGHCSIDWESLFGTAEEHGVGPLVGKNLLKCCGNELALPSEMVHRINLYIYREVINSEKRLQVLREGLEFLAGKQLRTMLVKGVAASLQVYDYPWYTVSKDFDIIIDKKQNELSPDEHAEIGAHFHRKGIEYDFYEHHDISINGVLPVDFGQIWQKAIPFQFRGQETSLMCPEDFLISLCINSSRKRYFRLKSLGDIAETIRKFPTLDWEYFIHISRQYDCSRIVYAALQAVQSTLGADLPDKLLDRLKVNPVRASLINLTIRILLNSSSPAHLATTSDGRQIKPALILSYLTYHGYQIKRKLDFVRTHPAVKP